MRDYYKQEGTEKENKNHKKMSSLPSIPSIEEVENILSTRDLIYRLKQSNLGLTDDDYEVLEYHKIIGRTFLLLTEEKLESRGVKLGPTLNITHSINKIREHNSNLTSTSSQSTQPDADADYLDDDIETLREDFREIVDNKFTIAGLKSKINTSLLVKDVYSVCGEDTISGKTLRDFYNNNTNLSKHTYPVVRQWIEHKKRLTKSNFKVWYSNSK